jgi:hypothetical protein
MLRQLSKEAELAAAKKLCPYIVQEIKDIRDFLTGIMLDTKDNMLAVLHESIKHPTLYYRVTEDDRYTYAFYMTFHPFDWSDCKIALIRKLDEHLFDTESFCIRCDKFTGIQDVATIHHLEILKKYNVTVFQSGGAFLMVEGEGHGIHPWDEDDTRQYHKMGMNYSPASFTFGALDSVLSSEHLQKALDTAKVDTPSKQANNGIMYLNPDILFKEN